MQTTSISSEKSKESRLQVIPNVNGDYNLHDRPYKRYFKIIVQWQYSMNISSYRIFTFTTKPKLINNSSDGFNCKLVIGLMSYFVSMSICMRQDSHMSMIPGIGFLYGCMIKVHFVKTSFFTFFIMNNEQATSM